MLQGVPSVVFFPGGASTKPELDGVGLVKEYLTTRYHTPKDSMSQPLDYGSSAGAAGFIFLAGYEKTVDVAQIAALREQGHSWRAIANELGVGEGTVRRAALPRAKNVSEIGTGTALVSGTEQNGMRHRHLFVALTLEPRGGF